MKTINKTLTFILLITLTACMPDSFTKFKEDPPAKKSTTSSGGSTDGGSGGSGSTTTAPSYIQVKDNESTFIYIVGEPIEEYDLEGNVTSGDPEDADRTEDPNISVGPIILQEVGGTATADEISYSISPSTLPSGMTFDSSTGKITGTPTVFSPLTTYSITATHSPTNSIVYSSTPLTPVTVNIGVYTKITDFFFPQSVGQNLIITVDNPGLFTLGSDVSNSNGVVGTVRWIQDNDLYVQVTSNPNTKAFVFEDGLDNSATFSTKRAEISSVNYAFQTEAASSGTLPYLPTGFSPTLVPSSLNASTELADWITWTISPTLPGSVVLDTGTIASLSAGGNFGGAGTLSGFVDSAVSGNILSTSFTIKAQSGPNLASGDPSLTLSSQTFSMSFLDYPLPKKISTIDYRIPASSQFVFEVESTTPFTVAGSVSNAHGFVGTITAIDTTQNLLYVTTTASVSPWGYADASHVTRSGIDNSATFFVAETNITNVTRRYPVGAAISMIPDSNVKSSVEGALSGIVSFTNGSTTVTGIGTKFKSEILAGANAQIILDGTAYTVASIANNTSLTLSAAYGGTSRTNVHYKIMNIDQVNERQTHTYTIAPDPSIVLGGTFTFSNTHATNPGLLTDTGVTSVLSAQTFTVNATDLLSNTATTNFRLETYSTTSNPPQGLAAARSVLLNVPSASNFAVGDFISSDDGATGIVLGTFSVSTFNDFIEVQLINGEFQPFDDLDNIKTFQAQRSYIYASGVRPYSAALTVSDDALFSDSAGSNDIWIGGGSYAASSNTGYITYKYDAGNKVYVMIEKGTFTTGNTVQNDAGESETINVLQANNSVIVTSGATGYAAGQDITTDANGIGTIHSISGTSINVGTQSGTFTTTADVNGTNPYSAASGITISSVSHDPTFYLYNGEQSSINLKLNVKGSEALNTSNFTIVGSGGESLPGSYTTTVNTAGDGFVISMLPSSDFGLTKVQYTATYTNNDGSVSTNFNIQVFDHYQVAVTTEAYSYIMHRGGQGLNRTPCRARADSINNGVASDMTCLLEVGELDLWNKGIQFTITSGDDMCQYYTQKPFGFFNFMPGSTSGVTINRLEGDYSNILCAERYNGGTALLQFPDFSASYQPTTSTDMCQMNYTASNSAAPNCDIGTVTTDYTFNFTSGTACLNQACSVGGGIHTTYTACNGAGGTWSPETTTYDANLCSENYGSCTGSATSCGGGGCSTKTACEADSGTWNDSSVFDAYCLRSASVTPNLTESCGASDYSACVQGAQSDMFGTGTNGNTTRITPAVNGSPLVVDFGAPADKTTATDVILGTSLYYANYMNSNSCTSGTYNYDHTNWNTYKTTTPIDDPLKGNTGWEINCVDSSFNIKARVRLLVRDWDRAFRASSNIDRISPAGLMDDAGVDGFGVSYNAFNDFDVQTNPTHQSFSACGTRNANSALTGTVTIEMGSAIVTGAGTAFSTELTAGNVITIGGNSYLVGQINSDTELILWSRALTNSAGVAATKVRANPFPIFSY